MTARELYQAGKVNEAIQKLGAELRDNPVDAGTGSLLYPAVATDERRRNSLFEKGDYLGTPADTPPIRGSLDRQAFESIEDTDERIGPWLEIYAAGTYMWLPLEHAASVQMEAPKTSARFAVDSGPCAHRAGIQRTGTGGGADSSAVALSAASARSRKGPRGPARNLDVSFTQPTTRRK
jgi:hypothetical protein